MGKVPAQLLISSILETLAAHWGFGGSEQGSLADPKKAFARKALKGGFLLEGRALIAPRPLRI